MQKKQKEQVRSLFYCASWNIFMSKLIYEKQRVSKHIDMCFAETEKQIT